MLHAICFYINDTHEITTDINHSYQKDIKIILLVIEAVDLYIPFAFSNANNESPKN